MAAFVGNIGDIGGVFVEDTEDIEDVISDIQDIINYVPLHKVESVLERSLKLLKEQKAVEPIWSCGKPFCGACGLRIHDGQFCSKCGKPILWGGR